MKKYISSHKLLTLTLLLFSVIFAAAKDIVNVSDQFGIGIRKVTSLCQDSVGFVYGVSNTGVTRISSSDCRTYELPQKYAMYLANIFAVGNDVYVITHNGQMYKLDREKDEFTKLAYLGDMVGVDFMEVYDVCADSDKTIYISSDQGLIRLKNEKFDSVIGDDVVWYACPTDDTHILYIGRGGIYNHDLRSGKSEIFSHTSEMMPVLSAYFDKATSMLWIGTLSNSVYTVDVNAPGRGIKKVAAIDTHQPVRAIDSYCDSTVLVGIDGAGVCEVSKDGSRLCAIYADDIDNPESLKGNGVNDILCASDRTWIATYTGGVSYFDNGNSSAKIIRHIPGNRSSIVDDEVNYIVQDKKGRVWYATNNGVSRHDLDDDSWTHYLQRGSGSRGVVQTLCVDGDDLWVGTYGDGVYVLDADTGAVKKHLTDSVNPACRFVFDIFKDSDGDIWIGASEGGVAMYSKKDDKYTNYATNAVNSFIQIGEGIIVGSGPLGYAFFDKGTAKAQLFFEDGYDVHECYYDGNDLWLATSCHGLIRRNLKSAVSTGYTTDQGLPSNIIYSITPIGDDCLLLGTESGICCFDKNKATVAMVLNGIPCNMHAATRLADGRYVIGTSKGAVIYDANETSSSVNPARLYIQDITVGGRPLYEVTDIRGREVNALEEIEIGYTKDAVSIEALYVGGSHGNKVAWKLEGIEDEWTTPADQSTISYANLPWGEYTLRIRLYDSGGVYVLDSRMIKITVAPPFWASWWFISLVAFVALVLISSVVWVGVKRMKERYLEERLQFLTKTMLDMQNMLNIMKAPIEQLKDTSQIGPADREYYLKLLNSQTNRLSLIFARLFTLEEEEAAHSHHFFTPDMIMRRMKRRREMIESVLRWRLRWPLKKLAHNRNMRIRTAVRSLWRRLWKW